MQIKRPQYKISQEVILTGDNFEVPNVGIRGVVAAISPGGYVKIEWTDGHKGWFSPYQSTKWFCRAGG